MDKGLKWILGLIFLVNTNVYALSLENNIKSHELIGEVYDFFLDLEEDLIEREIIIESIDDLTIREGCSSEITLSFPSEGELERQDVCAGEVLIHIVKVELGGSSGSGYRWGVTESARVRNNIQKTAPDFLCNSESQSKMIDYDIQVMKYFFSYNGHTMYLGDCNGDFLEKAEMVWHQQN